MGRGCLVYLLALFVVGAVFPNMFLEMLHEAVIRNMIGKGGVARGTRWWVGRHAASQPGYPLRCQFMRAHARCGTKVGMSLERPVRPRSLLLWLAICCLFPCSSIFSQTFMQHLLASAIDVNANAKAYVNRYRKPLTTFCE